MNYMVEVIVNWAPWLLIPWFIEMVFTVTRLFRIYSRRNLLDLKGIHALPIYPEITIIITLDKDAYGLVKCMDSIEKSLYPDKKIRILIVGDQMDLFNIDVYDMVRKSYPNLSMQWVDSRPGWDHAMNQALYATQGPYVFCVSGHGELHPQALRQIVTDFENNIEAECIRGMILPKTVQIQKEQSLAKRILKELEFIAYAHTYFNGRESLSYKSTLYTSAKSLMAFRKTNVMQKYIRLSHPSSVAGYESHTFMGAMKEAKLCRNALFYTESAPSLSQLYILLQIFCKGILSREWNQMQMDHNPLDISKTSVLVFMNDQLYALPKMVWMVGVFALMVFNGYLLQVPGALLFMYFSYLLLEYLRSLIVLEGMSNLPEVRSFYNACSRALFLIPGYVLFYSLSGFMALFNRDVYEVLVSSSLQKEWNAFKEVLHQDMERFSNPEEFDWPNPIKEYKPYKPAAAPQKKKWFSPLFKNGRSSANPVE